MKRRQRAIRGQAMTEFMVMAAISIGIIWMLVYVLGYYSEYIWRILALIALDYP